MVWGCIDINRIFGGTTDAAKYARKAHSSVQPSTQILKDQAASVMYNRD